MNLLKKPRVLQVEDDDSIYELVKHISDCTDTFSLERVSSISGLRSFYANFVYEPSIILSDYQLPDGSAADVLQITEEQGLNCPIVVLSGSRLSDIVKHLCSINLDGRVHRILSKPFSVQDLIETLTFFEIYKTDQEMLEDLNTK